MLIIVLAIVILVLVLQKKKLQQGEQAKTNSALMMIAGVLIGTFRYHKSKTGNNILLVFIDYILMMIFLAYIGETDHK